MTYSMCSQSPYDISVSKMLLTIFFLCNLYHKIESLLTLALPGWVGGHG